MKRLAERLVNTKRRHIRSLKFEEKTYMRSVVTLQQKYRKTTPEDKTKARRIKRHMAIASDQKRAIKDTIADIA
jgi:hypothetical protein